MLRARIELKKQANIGYSGKYLLLLLHQFQVPSGIMERGPSCPTMCFKCRRPIGREAKKRLTAHGVLAPSRAHSYRVLSWSSVSKANSET